MPADRAASATAGYVGRFAPSPTGPLHAGSLVAALASWLDARAHGGRWLVRIEDVDGPRCPPGMDAVILQQLQTLGLIPDAPPLRQSQRSTLYTAALDRLRAKGLAYGCSCSRQDIARVWASRGVAQQRHAELPYPGTCRNGPASRNARAWRLRLPDPVANRPSDGTPKGHSAIESGAMSAIDGRAAASPVVQGSRVVWFDRRLGWQRQDVAEAVGDFVLRRADGLWAYQLAVVVDDAEQGVTHVVRGEDLADNTPRQILLQRALDLPTPRYLHTPLVLAADGQKLSKQNGAAPLDLSDPLARLREAAQVLQLPEIGVAQGTGDWLGIAVGCWRRTIGGDEPDDTSGRRP